ncbi:hypothetical protein [Sphaerotilus microaerophilus]|uniref:Bulb-type lectin domain-containing protein n=1 Tax=Sphaerotilus microaerophilus TaxID=2914710 RepID=A0ABM7YLG4_9BURK|nr:hypothetical protein [Sphaerotilus sp. FB-5]BDI05278.1 hypothetical protein CATMQ487_22480 [Sphaerotilus sp. FB-5]
MPQGTDHLLANESLQHGQSIVSNNGIYQLAFQGDGNLVVYKTYPGTSARTLWASGTNGHSSDTCIMQGDGNLVLYDPGSHAIWAAGTYGNPGSRVVMQDDGNLAIYRANNSPAWATNTVQNPVPGGPPAHGSQMQPGETLAKDQPIHSANGRYEFVFQSDGNLVLYKIYSTHPRRALWASGTNGRGAVVCIMQGDGNLVIYDSDAHALWSSGTYNHAGSHLTVQDDGNVVIYQPNNAAVWATNTVQIAVPSGPPAHGDTMNPGEILPIDHPIKSPNGRYSFVFQGDGNLVLYKSYPTHPTKALWSSKTNGKTADVCIMQGDGNLVLYDPDGHPMWSSGTYNHAGSHLTVQDDGNVVIYQPNNAAVWATNTVQTPVPSGPTATGDSMQPGQTLAPGQAIKSAGQAYLFVFQGDGNLVLYKIYAGGKQKALWSSGTCGRLADICIMQGDGNLVIYDPDGHAIWASNTWGKPGSHLVAQDDGNVVIYRPGGQPTWSTGTYGMHVHFKTLLSLTPTVRAYIDRQFAALDDLYIDGSVNTTMGTIEDLSGDSSLSTLLDLDVGACTSSSLTDEQRILFSQRNNCGANDLVVYLVSSLVGGSGNFVGCASHPSDRPACAIVQDAGADWLTAHEIGHVLGLSHVSSTPATNSDYLMWPNVGWTNTPPDLSSSEYKKMRDSNLTPVS